MKKLILTFVFLILISSFVFSVDEASSSPASSTLDIRNTFINEEIKTRNDLKSYFDLSNKKLIDDTSSKCQVFVDENVKALDQRIQGFVNKALFKMCIGIIASIITGALFVYMIHRWIKKADKQKEVF